MNRKVTSCTSSLWWGEATDEPAREDARPTTRFMAPIRFSLAQNCVEFFVYERLHRIGADVAEPGQEREHVQHFLFTVGSQDQNAVPLSHGPILAFDFHAGFRRQLVEVVGAVGGFLDVFCS